jgi:hypothetical protein
MNNQQEIDIDYIEITMIFSINQTIYVIEGMIPKINEQKMTIQKPQNRHFTNSSTHTSFCTTVNHKNVNAGDFKQRLVELTTKHRNDFILLTY